MGIPWTPGHTCKISWISDSGHPRRLIEFALVIHAGPLATKNCEPGQARKGAATAVDSGAEVWLAWSH